MAKSDRRQGLLFFIFFLSGMSALIYEVVWLRNLIRVLGCTVYATSTVLAAFMAGMALGSYVLGKRADRTTRLLRFYAILELGIGLTALGIPFVFDLLIPVYRWFFTLTSGSILTIFRAVLLFFVLIVPTTMMGGTLPVLSGLLARDGSRFGNRIGGLYGINTLGAVFGVFGTGFIFLGLIGEFNTIILGVVSNLCAAAIAYYMDRKWMPSLQVPKKEPETETRERAQERRISPYSTRTRRIVILAFSVSGFAALSYEVVWTRILQLFLKTSIYAFSTMLGIYLIGIALGSLLGRKFVDRMKDPIFLFAALEMAVAAFAVLGLSLLVPMDSNNFRNFFRYFGRFLTAGVLIFPITICLGILFPTVARCFTRSEENVGESIGRVYSLNTVGCILGSLVCGFLLIPQLGSGGTILAVAGINILLGMLLFMTDFQRFRRPLTLAVIIGSLGLTISMAVVVENPFFEIIEQRIQRELHDDGIIYLHRESAAATVTAFGSRSDDLQKHLWINGFGMTSLVTETKLMAHLPILLCEEPQDVLIICFGMGTTLRSTMVHDNLNVDVVELVEDTYDAFRFYHQDGPEILRSPRVQHYVDDGRNFLLMRKKTYDIITIDPSPPVYSAGTVNLYSQEFISLCKMCLKPDGVLCLWVPPCRYSEARMIMRTFQSGFPNASLWRGMKYPGLYLIGTHKPLNISINRFRQASENQKFMDDINEWDTLLPSAEAITDLFLLNATELREYLRDVPIVTDNYPYTEFPLWRWIFHSDAKDLYTVESVLRWKEEYQTYLE